MRRVITTLSLALFVVGCGPVPLLTGGSEGCSIGTSGIPMSIVGVLIPDPRAGTAIKVESPPDPWPAGVGNILPVRWPTGYTARRVSFDVEVLNTAGDVVAKTGAHVELGAQWDGSLNDGVFPACGGSELPPS